MVFPSSLEIHQARGIMDTLNTRPQAALLDTQQHLSAPVAFLWIFAGGAASGLLIMALFALQKYLSPYTEADKDAEQPLLPEPAEATACGPQGWRPPSSKVKAADEAATPWGALMFSVLIAIPSVLGSWCWPLLVVALIPAANSNVASDNNREIAHHFSLGSDFVLFGAIMWYLGRTAFSTPPTPSNSIRWGPFAVACLASVLLILDPIRHVLLDHGGVFFKEATLAMYAKGGGLSAIGKFCQCSSITGLILLLSGLLWHFRVPEAIVHKFGGKDN